MKKIVLLFLSTLTLLSCETDLEQNSALEPGFEQANAESLVIASYAYLKAAVNFNFYFGDLRSDDGFSDSGEEPHILFDQFSSDLIRATDEMLEPFWKGHVIAITHVNNAINNSSDSDPINGEARFLRAYSYFSLVQVFGGVPIVTEGAISLDESNSLKRGSVEDVYSLIISDLTKAISSLTNESTDGRPSSFAAQALLAKVYMTQGNTVAAEPLLENVINNSGATLQTDYASVFSNDNELNSEILFAIQYDSGDVQVDKFEDLNLDPTNLFTTGLSGSESKIRYPVTDDLTNAYDALDVRDDATFNGTGVLKYLPADPSVTTDKNSDYIVLRLADIILLHAEAVNANAIDNSTIASTLALFDDIRVRAGLPVLVAADFATTAAVEQAIKDERRFELAFEGHRWFDLVRWGDAKSVLDFTNDDYLLFPLPLREVNATGGSVEQNPGY